MSRGSTARFRETTPKSLNASIDATLVAAAQKLMDVPDDGDPIAHACRITHSLLGADLVVAFESADEGVFRTQAQYGVPDEDWVEYQAVELTGDMADTIRARLADGGVFVIDVAEPGTTPDDTARRSIARKLGLGPLMLLGLRTLTQEVFTGLVIVSRRQEKGSFSARDLQIAEGLSRFLAAHLKTHWLVRDLHASNAVQSEFLASMSHELRSPLHVIMGYVEILLDGASGELNQKQREMCDRIHAGAVRQLSLVGETFEMSRRDDEGRMPVREEVTELGALVAELERETAVRPRAAEVDVGWDAPAADVRVVTDPLKFRMIVRNLVENAIKFTRQGEVRIKIAVEDDGLVCRVRDTGVGIPEAEREAVFEAFRQVGGPRATGLGLGLYIVRRVVDALSGTVEVESVVGEGSMFTVRVPVTVVDPPA